jgi:hypothetical protein
MAKSPKKPLDKAAEALDKAAKTLKGRKATSGALASAVLGGIIKLTNVTDNWTYPLNMLGEIIIFFAILFVVADIAKGGLED